MTYREKIKFPEAELATNNFKNCRYVIYYETRNGKFENLFTLEESELDFLLTTSSIRDENGCYLGKLIRNNISQSEKGSLTSGREYETKRVPNKFWLKDGDTSILAVRAETPGLWIINGVFHIKLGKEEIIVKIEINDVKTIISSRFDPTTHERTTNFIRNGAYYNNDIENAGGIRLSISETRGISIELGFLEPSISQSHYKS